MKQEKCVMCGESVRFLVEAKYSTGTVEEPLCERCTLINNEIIRRRG